MTSPPRLARIVATAAALTTGLAALTVPAGSPATATGSSDPTYTVQVGAAGPLDHGSDAPPGLFTDKDGTFWFQLSGFNYGANDGASWRFHNGVTMDALTESPISEYANPSNPQDSNGNTDWRCNNSVTGQEATYAPDRTQYAERNYCDLINVWVDPDTGDWYGMVHNEFTPNPMGDSMHFDSIDVARSTDQGKTWAITNHAITSPFSTTRGDTTAFPNQTYYWGDGDPRLYVDTASGYFYVYYGSRIVGTGHGGAWGANHAHVARAPISGKMAANTWQKWYDGSWSQPGVGGKESNMVPVDASSSTGYTPPAKEYDPQNTGTINDQIAAGTIPPTSQLFVMDITYDAYLGLYVGEPEQVLAPGTKGPQQFYVTDNLATQKWRLAGDTGTSWQTSSWYRFFVDSANRTSSNIIGKSFRAYCSISCSAGSGGEYHDITIDSSAGPATPVDTTKSYRIGAQGRLLAQVPGTSQVTSVGTDNGSAAWSFAAQGDGSYLVVNTASGDLLGVDSRAWGAKPSAAPRPARGPSAGQQWFVVPGRSAATGAATGDVRLVNRFSGLVVALSATSGRLAETAPVRHWSDTSGSGVGDGRVAAEQALTLSPAGNAALAGVHVLSIGGQALDDPGHSTTAGTQMVTWAGNGGRNQQWLFTANADGSFTIANVESGLCLDVEGGSLTAGAKIIQWGCTGGANQHWFAEAQTDGSYTFRSAQGGLLLTTASTSNGAGVTQQADSGSSLQRWTLTSPPANTGLDGGHTVTVGGKALTNGGQASNGAPITAATADGSQSQRWTFAQRSDGSYTVTNAASGKCLEVPGATSTASGLQLDQWDCNGGANQRWWTVELTDGTYLLVAGVSGKVLAAASGADGAAVTQEPYPATTLPQRWTIS